MKKLMLTLSLLLLNACNNDQSGNDSDLVGIWITESCQQVIPINEWHQALYEFTVSGNILLGRRLYSDSNCLNLKESVLPNEISEDPFEYEDLGPVELEEGIDGNALKLSTTSVPTFSRSAFYTINSGILCFSEAFTFDVFVFSFTEAGESSIDFNKCLSKL